MATAEMSEKVTADETLAALILADLVATKLIDGDAAKKVLPKLVSGKLTSFDWRSLLWAPKPSQAKASQ